MIITPMTAYAVFHSGTCGENLTWTLLNSTLTISGTGAMTDFNLIYDNIGGLLYVSSSAPWYEYRSYISTVIIEDGVTSIGSAAFLGTGLINITIPDSVTSIGRGAFDFTWEINQPDDRGVVYAGKVVHSWRGEMPENTSLILNEGTKGIAGWAFFGLLNLVKVTIPDSVENIREMAFLHCENLESITFKSVTPPNFGCDVFYSCDNFKTIYVPMGAKSSYEAARCYHDEIVFDGIDIVEFCIDCGESSCVCVKVIAFNTVATAKISPGAMITIDGGAPFEADIDKLTLKIEKMTPQSEKTEKFFEALKAHLQKQ
jgi:hypothetical protein